VLIVDDEPLIRWSLSEGLAECGYAVRLAANAAEAQAILAGAAGTPMVLLLDLRLPDAVDLSLMREVRTKWPDVPVVLMTAHGTPMMRGARGSSARFVSWTTVRCRNGSSRREAKESSMDCWQSWEERWWPSRRSRRFSAAGATPGRAIRQGKRVYDVQKCSLCRKISATGQARPGATPVGTKRDAA
jgi:CheY-like chemotaxis protein